MSSAPANIHSPPSPQTDPRYMELVSLPDHLGSMVCTLEGKILAKRDQMEGEETARAAFLLMRDAARLAELETDSSSPKAPGAPIATLESLTVLGPDGCVYAGTVSEERVYVVKRRRSSS